MLQKNEIYEAVVTDYTAEGIEMEVILDDILYGRLRDYIAMEL